MTTDQTNTPKPVKKLSLRKRIVFSALATTVFFTLAECTFRVIELVYPPRNIDFGMGFDSNSRVFGPSRLHPDQLETDPAKRVSFVRQKFPIQKPAKTFRIVALGGSSVNYLEKEFNELERELANASDRFDKVEIINCGGFAYGSHRLVVVMREMLEYSPDLILLYSGHNEFEEVEQLQLSGVKNIQFEKTISSLAIVRFIRDRKADYELSKLEREHNQRVLSSVEPVSDTNFARAWQHQFNQEDVVVRMQQYEHNLRLILSVADRNKTPVIIGTVSSNLLQPYLPQGSAAKYKQVYDLWKNEKTEEGLELAKQILKDTVGRHQCSELENEIIRQLAAEFSLPLVDVESMVADAEPNGIPGETMFDDHCHLNRSGRAVWIKGYEPSIRAALQAPISEPK